MKNSTIENLIVEVMMQISRFEGYRAHCAEKVREARGLEIMGRIEAKEIEARERLLEGYDHDLKELNIKLTKLEALR